MYTYLYQRIHSPFFVLVYIGVHGIGDSPVDYACGVCAIDVAIASCCCCFHGVTNSSRSVVNFAVNGSIDGSARVVMCFRLVDSRYAATCDNYVRIAGIGTVGCVFNVDRRDRFDAGVDALCGGIGFCFLLLVPPMFLQQVLPKKTFACNF